MNVKRQTFKINMLSCAAIALVTAFAVLVATLHFLKPEINPIHNFISEYATGKYGYLMTAAFLCLAFGSIIIAMIIYIIPIKSKAIILIPMFVWSICILLAAIYPTDIAGTPETTHGHIHNIASIAGFISLVASSFIYRDFYSNQFPEQHSLIAKRLPAIILFLFLAMLITIRNGSPLTGLFQRIFISGVVIWLVVFAVTLKNISRLQPNKVHS